MMTKCSIRSGVRLSSSIATRPPIEWDTSEKRGRQRQDVIGHGSKGAEPTEYRDLQVNVGRERGDLVLPDGFIAEHAGQQQD
ncbi:MAG: hypothetical protein ACO280_04160 [Pseudohongiellaceae bacterium]